MHISFSSWIEFFLNVAVALESYLPLVFTLCCSFGLEALSLAQFSFLAYSLYPFCTSSYLFFLISCCRHHCQLTKSLSFHTWAFKVNQLLKTKN